MNRLSGSLIAAMAIALGSPGAEKPPKLPKDLPPYGPVVPFRAPQVEIKKLDNGLTLWLVPRPGFPKVAFALAVRGGMAADPKDRAGLSQLLVATVDQGTKTRSAKQDWLKERSYRVVAIRQAELERDLAGVLDSLAAALAGPL